MITAGIIGGAGYTAGELLRLLMHHPEVEIAFVQSNSHAGKPISSIHDDLTGETQLGFVAEMPLEPEVLFLCQGHGKARIFLENNPLFESVKIIDLGNDFRLKKSADGFVYGLPELNKKEIQGAQKIANPGCFATAIQLALLPLAANGWLENDVHIHAITGSTGAGQQLTETSHFSWRNNNVSVYKPFRHQHLEEIWQSVHQLQAAFSHQLNFVPVRGNFSRGIFASLYTKTYLSLAAIQEAFEAYYAQEPFVHLAAENPSLKQVVNTNKCLLHLDKVDGKLFIVSIIDNLLKGASGQAVQNMNLMFGLEETLSLKLKAVAF
jgi:N-acetyl-gamma-glutamyl-phosphate reductase